MPQDEELTPDDFIVKGKETFAMLFNIFNRTKKLQQQQQIQSKLQQQQLDIQQQQLTLLTKILKEQKDEADECAYLRKNGSVTTTSYTIIDTIKDPGHPIKGYNITNDGDNTIYIGHNVVTSGDGADIIDVTSDLSRFTSILSGETFKCKYNRNGIKNIYMLASVGNSIYRIELVW